MASLLTILIIAVKVIVAFSALIMIHELGHFLVAKISGVWVEEYGLGLPPRIFGKKIGETIYSLNWLPIGGFVKLHGENLGDKVTYPDRAFTNKRKITKIAITVAGIVMNLLLAILCFAIVYSFLGIPGKIDIRIVGVTADSPAKLAGVQTDDIIEKVNNVEVKDETQFVGEVSKFKGQSANFEIKRGKDTLNLKITPRLNPPAGEGSLGVEFSAVQETYYPPVWQRPFVGAWYGLKQTLELSKAVVFGLGGAVQSVSKGQSPKGVVGPVGIVGLFIEFAKLGLLPLINLVGVISVNLAIINLIPFPPLDGSRIALTIAEWITRKKLTAKMEERVYLIGFVVLIGLMILITSREIPAVFHAGSLSKYINSILNQK